MTKKYNEKKFGPFTKRRIYSEVKNNLEVTDLNEIQKKSFEHFLNTGINETFNKIYPFESNSRKIKIENL